MNTSYQLPVSGYRKYKMQRAICNTPLVTWTWQLVAFLPLTIDYSPLTIDH
ncbi:hypothetical protein [Longitalea luteola]|uniref:hypothetical protein n=1 Tax=Longitalea luteola TaxID=2812563 RepID=UPI001A96BD61|nr:hypothetical protein [Longitalea luteola]